jgi:hypothetical protein
MNNHIVDILMFPKILLSKQEDKQDDVDSLLHSAIKIDQSIVAESALLQSNPAGSALPEKARL